MLKKSLLVLAVAAASAACGESGTPAATTETPAAPAAETLAPTAASITRDGAIALMNEGKPFKVVFDTCPVPDEGWTGDSDPYGTIKCGQTYSVSYSSATSEYTATGLNEGSNSETTSVAGGATPAEGGISIWGATFVVGDGGVVSTSDGVAVGHFKGS